MKDYVIVSATDRGYFPMCLGLVLSIRRLTQPNVPDIVILDLGLDPTKRETLTSLGCKIVDPGWDLDTSSIKDCPPWFKAMTARPFLPKHASGYDKYLWIDCDAWVQAWEPIETLLSHAENGAIALVEEEYGATMKYVEIGPRGPRETIISPDMILANVTRCYTDIFGPAAAEKYSKLPILNSGVFALERNSPVWSEWQEVLRAGLTKGIHKLMEQQALNIVIRSNRAPAALHGPVYNFLCSHGTPDYDSRIKRFVTSGGELIGVIHLGDLKMTRSVEINVVPGEQTAQTSLHYLDLICSVG